MPTERQGVILLAQNGLYTVRSDGADVLCKASPRLRIESIRPQCGDRVLLTLNDDASGYITAVSERKNSLIRPRIANIDKLVVVSSVAEPRTDLFLTDVMTAVAVASGIEPVVVVNKSDLADAESVAEIYRKCRFSVFCTDAVDCEGTDALRDELKGCVSCFSGVSGAGKSSLMRALYPELEVEVGELSERIMRGKNTTRTTHLYCVGEDTYIADSPGFGFLDPDRFDLIKPEDLCSSFPEMREYLGTCRFTKCTHTSELGCKVIEAVKNGTIASSRHESFVRLYNIVHAKKQYK